jgi:hypothetical protein
MRLQDYEPMWTKYVLLLSQHGYTPVDVTGDEPMAVLIDEDDDWPTT